MKERKIHSKLGQFQKGNDGQESVYNQVYPETTDEDVLIDIDRKNKELPENATTLKDVIDNLSRYAFKTENSDLVVRHLGYGNPQNISDVECGDIYIDLETGKTYEYRGIDDLQGKYKKIDLADKYIFTVYGDAITTPTSTSLIKSMTDGNDVTSATLLKKRRIVFDLGSETRIARLSLMFNEFPGFYNYVFIGCSNDEPVNTTIGFSPQMNWSTLVNGGGSQHDFSLNILSNTINPTTGSGKVDVEITDDTCAYRYISVVYDPAEVSDTNGSISDIHLYTLETDEPVDIGWILKGDIEYRSAETNGYLEIIKPNGDKDDVKVYVHPEYNVTETTSSSYATYSSVISMIDDIDVDGTGHVVGYNKKDVTLPSKYVHPTYDVTKDETTETPDHSEMFNVISGITHTNGHLTGYTVSSIILPDQYTHPIYKVTKTTSTDSPLHSDSVIMVDSIDVDETGHVEGFNTKTVTLPDQYTHPAYDVSKTQSALSASHGGTFTVIDSLIYENGHLTGYNTKSITLPSGYIHPTYTVSPVVDSTSLDHSGDFTVISGVTVNELGHITGYDKTTFTLPSQYIHPTYDVLKQTTTTSPSHGTSVDVIDDVTVDGTGHVTSYRTKTITLPDGYEHPTYTVSPTTDSSSLDHDDEFTVISGVTVNELGHVSGYSKTTFTLPSQYIHPTYNVLKPTSTSSPSHGTSVDVIDDVTVDGTGHVTSYRTKTITLPDGYVHPVYEIESPEPTKTTLNHSGDFTVISGVTVNELGHITGYDKTTFTLPSQYVHPTYTVNAGTSTDTPDYSDTIDVVTGLTYSNGHLTGYTTTSITLPDGYVHPTYNVSQSTTTASPSHGESFTVIDSLGYTNGHLTSYRTKTITLPTGSDSAYGVCETSHSDAAKTVSISNFRLYTGVTARIKFTYANRSDNVTLNISDTGAKPLYYKGIQASSNNTWDALQIVDVVYDGSKWIVTGSDSMFVHQRLASGTDLNTIMLPGIYQATQTVNAPNQYGSLIVCQTDGTAGSACINQIFVTEGSHLLYMRYSIPESDGGILWQSWKQITAAINGGDYSSDIYAPRSAGTSGYELISNGSGAPVWKAPSYAVCSTAAATTAKTVSITNFKLYTGAKITVKFTYTNTASDPTLNVSGTGAKPLRWSCFGDGLGVGYQVNGNQTYDLMYDGTNWNVVADHGIISDLMAWNIDQGLSIASHISQYGSTDYNINAYLNFTGSGYLTINDDRVLYGVSTSNTITNGTTSWYAPTSVGTDGQILKSTGSGNPSWASTASLSLTMNGTTTSYNPLSASNNSRTWYAPTTSGSSGQILKSTGSGAPSWASTASYTLTMNGTGYNYSPFSGTSRTWYAPTSVGTAGHELISNGSGAPIWKAPSYAVCDTAGATAAKTVSISNFKLYTGAKITVKFTNANSASDPTLNVSQTGEKPLKWSCYSDSLGGSYQVSGSGTTYDIMYDGTNWNVVADHGFIGNHDFIGDLMNWNVDQGLSIAYNISQCGPTDYDINAYLNFTGSGYLTIAGDRVLYGLSTSNTITDGTTSWYAPTSVGSSGQILKSTGSGNPSWTTPSSLTLTLNGGSSSYSPFSSMSKSWYAPTSAGTTGYELISNGSGAPIWKAPSYATCETAAATVAKTASVTNFKLVTGCRVAVKFTYTNTAASPTLNISGTGAKTIKWGQTTSPLNTNSTAFWLAGDIVEFLYDGTNWVATSSTRGVGGYFYGNIRIKNGNAYGTMLNFGDGDYVHLYEYEDDKLEIKANSLKLTASSGIYLPTSSYIGTTTTYRVVGTTTGHNTKIHVEPTTPTTSNMSIGDLWFKIPS